MRCDHDRVRIAINHLTDRKKTIRFHNPRANENVTHCVTHLLRGLDSLLKGLPSNRSDERGNRLAVEARVLEAKTAVHAICNDLKSFLPNVKTLLLARVTRGKKREYGRER